MCYTFYMKIIDTEALVADLQYLAKFECMSDFLYDREGNTIKSIDDVFDRDVEQAYACGEFSGQVEFARMLLKKYFTNS